MAMMRHDPGPQARQQYQLALAADPKSEPARTGLAALGTLEANPKLARAAKTDSSLARTSTTTSHKVVSTKKPARRWGKDASGTSSTPKYP
jgi:hypothetical protein